MEHPPEHALFVPLAKPPAAVSLTVRKLLGKAQNGAIRVPTFQRPLRWQTDDVVRLFDSILKGYPIGSLLFWKQLFPAEDELQIGAARLSVPEVADGWFIVDGQQRTTALAAALLDLDQRGDPRWEVRFDPASGQFRPGPPGLEEESRHVPLKILGDLRRLGRWLRDSNLSDAEQSRVEEVQQRVLDYEIPCYVVETDDVEALKGIFARLNSTGVRMRADEVFQALLGPGAASTNAQRGRLDLLALQRAVDVDGFGEPPRGEVLKAVLAMSGLDPSKRLEDLGDQAASKIVDAGDAAEALRRTAAFLQAPADAVAPGAGIPAYALIPYPVVFVILARWFYVFPEPAPIIRTDLGRWLWRGVVTGVHQRASVSAMRFQVREIKDNDPSASMTRLLDAVGEPANQEWSLDPFHANHAASRVELLALLSRGPRDLSGAVSWHALLSSGQRIAREIFRVDSVEDGTRKLAKTAANRILLDTLHSHLRSELRKWSWDKDRAAIESHLIDEAGFNDLQSNDSKAFLERRAARVRAFVSSFVTSRAGLGMPLVLPVNSYYDREPNGRSSGHSA